MSWSEIQSLDFGNLFRVVSVLRHAKAKARFDELVTWRVRSAELQVIVSEAVQDALGSYQLPNVMSAEARLAYDKKIREVNESIREDWLKRAEVAAANDQPIPDPPRSVVEYTTYRGKLAPLVYSLLHAVPGMKDIGKTLTSYAEAQQKLYVEMSRGKSVDEAAKAVAEQRPGRALFDALTKSNYLTVHEELEFTDPDEITLEEELEKLKAQGLIHDGDIRELLRGNPADLFKATQPTNQKE